MTDIELAAEYGEKLWKRNGWTPVGESLPTDFEMVDIWVVIHPSQRSMGISDAFRSIDCFRDNGKWFHFYKGVKTEIDINVVTHWRIIPEGPTDL